MTVASTRPNVDVYVFYFDVVGFADQFLEHGHAALERLRRFQRISRHAFEFGREHSYVVTLYDNVWARVNVAEPGLPSLLLDYAGQIMSSAESEGFPKYFGAITRGSHFYDPNDRMLVAGENFEDLREQHIDATSEPHIRAAFAEKWTAKLQLPQNCVWVSSEVAEPSTLAAQGGFPDSSFDPFGPVFDVADLPMPNGRRWPFSESRFGAICPKGRIGA